MVRDEQKRRFRKMLSRRLLSLFQSVAAASKIIFCSVGGFENYCFTVRENTLIWYQSTGASYASKTVIKIQSRRRCGFYIKLK